MENSDWNWLRSEVEKAAAAFVSQLATVTDTATKVPILDWDVAGLAAHLISLPAYFRSQHELGKPFEQPEDWPSFSISARSHITETDPNELGRMLQTEVATFLSEIDEDPEAERTLYNQQTTATGLAAGYLAELVLHGMDLAELTGPAQNPVKLTTRHANAIIAQQMVLAPFFVDRERARKCPGTYRLRFRGGEEYTYRIEDGLLTVEPGRPERADCHIIADPVAFVLTSLGRMSDVRAGLTGKIIGYGRKPWLLSRLGKITVDGV